MTANTIPAVPIIAARMPPAMIPVLAPPIAELVELGRAEEVPLTAGWLDTVWTKVRVEADEGEGWKSVKKTKKNKTEVWLTCAVVRGVEVIDELLGVVGVVEAVEVVEGIDEDVRVDDKVEGASMKGVS
jgi:hypothetical protein